MLLLSNIFVFPPLLLYENAVLQLSAHVAWFSKQEGQGGDADVGALPPRFLHCYRQRQLRCGAALCTQEEQAAKNGSTGAFVVSYVVYSCSARDGGDAHAVGKGHQEAATERGDGDRVRHEPVIFAGHLSKSFTTGTTGAAAAGQDRRRPPPPAGADD